MALVSLVKDADRKLLTAIHAMAQELGKDAAATVTGRVGLNCLPNRVSLVTAAEGSTENLVENATELEFLSLLSREIAVDALEVAKRRQLVASATVKVDSLPRVKSAKEAVGTSSRGNSNA